MSNKKERTKQTAVFVDKLISHVVDSYARTTCVCATFYCSLTIVSPSITNSRQALNFCNAVLRHDSS